MRQEVWAFDRDEDYLAASGEIKKKPPGVEDFLAWFREIVERHGGVCVGEVPANDGRKCLTIECTPLLN